MTRLTAQPGTGQPVQSKTLRVLKKVLPWVFLALLLVLLFSRVPLDQVIAEFRGMTLSSLVGLSIMALAFITGVCFIDGTALWYGFSLFQVKINWRRMVIIRAAMMLLASIATPIAQAGLMAHIGKRYQIKTTPAAGMVMYLFLIEVYGMIALSTLCMPAWIIVHYPEYGLSARLGVSLAMIGAAWPGLFFFFWLGRKAAGARFMERLKIAPLLYPLKTVSFKGFIKLLALKTALSAWQIALTVVAFVVYGLPPFPLHLFAFMPLAILINSVPVSPGRLGITQVSWVFFFGFLADEPALVALSLLMQFLLNVARWIIGAMVLPWYYKDTGMTERKSEEVENSQE